MIQQTYDVLTIEEWEFVEQVKEELLQHKMHQTAANTFRELATLQTIAHAIQSYPSPLETQKLGRKERTEATLGKQDELVSVFHLFGWSGQGTGRPLMGHMGSLTRHHYF